MAQINWKDKCWATTIFLVRNDLKVLLTWNKNLQTWIPVGGHIDVGETPEEAIMREVAEETGFDFTPTHILGIYSIFRKDLIKDFEQIRHPIRVIFIGKINKHQGQFKKEEIAETKWFSPEEIKKMDSNNLRHIDIKTMVKDYFAGKKYPIELLTHTISE